MRHALLQLKRKGSTDVFLSVRTTNEPALRLYYRLGFKRVRRIPNYYEDGADALRLKLTL